MALEVHPCEPAHVPQPCLPPVPPARPAQRDAVEPLDAEAKRNGLVAKPQTTVRPSKSDRIPAHVKRGVWERAGGRCEYVLESGERCGCTDQLEYDHITPRARGGKSTVANVRLVCRGHNDLAARLVFGDRRMDRYTRKRGRAGSNAESPPASVEASTGPP
jgi:5-methylcytosine-specific restriction endonuclease McrA